jgi:hypothetical protein
LFFSHHVLLKRCTLRTCSPIHFALFLSVSFHLTPTCHWMLFLFLHNFCGLFLHNWAHKGYLIFLSFLHKNSTLYIVCTLFPHLTIYSMNHSIYIHRDLPHLEPMWLQFFLA